MQAVILRVPRGESRHAEDRKLEFYERNARRMTSHEPPGVTSNLTDGAAHQANFVRLESLSPEPGGEESVEPTAIRPRPHEATHVERIAEQLPEIDLSVHLELTMMR